MAEIWSLIVLNLGEFGEPQHPSERITTLFTPFLSYLFSFLEFLKNSEWQYTSKLNWNETESGTQRA